MRSRLPWIILLIGAALPFVPLITAEFVRWDDPHNLFENPRMLHPSLENAAWYWTHPYKDLYIPVTYTIWSGISAVARTTSPAGVPELNSYVFHAFNLLIHLASTALIFLLLRSILNSATSTIAALVGALLFALHPIQVESVAWISGAKDLLAGCLGLLALYLLVIHLHDRRWPPYTAATAALILAMLSKPSAVVVPPIALLLALVPPRQALRLAMLRVGPWFLLAIPIILIGRAVQPAVRLDFVPPLHARPIVALDALAFYLRQLLVPVHFAIDYGRTPQWLLHSHQRFFTWIAPVLLLAFATLARRRFPSILLASGIFILALLPNLGLVPFDFQAYSTTTDHYAYLAMLGPALLVAFLLQRWQSRAAYATAGLILLALAIRTGAQTLVWQNSQTLFTHALAVNPDSLAGNVNLGRIYADQADAAYNAGRRPEMTFTAQAIPLYQRALQTAPHDFVARKSLANMYKFQHRWTQAEDAYRRALADAQGAGPIPRAEVHANLAAVLASQRRYQDALKEADAAIHLDPGFAYARVLREQIRAATARP